MQKPRRDDGALSGGFAGAIERAADGRERAEASARPACLPNTDLCREASDLRRRRLVLAERLWGLEVARLRPAVDPTDNADGKRGKTGAVTV